MTTSTIKGFNLFIAVFLFLFFLAGLNQAHAGWYTVYNDNDTNLAWGNYHFEISQISGKSGPLYDISNVVFDVLFNPPTVDHRPQSSQTLDSGNEWNLSSDGKKIDLYFYGDPFMPGETDGRWKVFINNPDGVLYSVSSYPSVVPEPVSSSLFILGGAFLGFRRFIKKRGIE